MITIKLKDREYNLASTLRVAYKVQGQHNHAPYSKVFEKLGEMTLEEQIDILYAAFEVANPDEAKFINHKVFLDEYLDNYTLSEVMNQLQEVIKGIMGTESSDSTTTNTGAEVSQGE